jgi:hypothetical protein
MDQQQSFRSQLVGWLTEIVPYGQIEKYTRKTREGFESNSFNTDHRANHVSYIICTAEHRYSISAHPTYLGCIASATRERPGEDWTRGNDLPDGPFCRETWEKIKNAIIRYELVKLVPIHESIGEEAKLPEATPSTPAEIEYYEASNAVYRAQSRLLRAKRALAKTDRKDPDLPTERSNIEVED